MATKTRRIIARCDDALYQKVVLEAAAAEMKISDYVRHIAAEHSVVVGEREALKAAAVAAQQRIEALESQQRGWLSRFFRRKGKKIADL